MPHGHRARASTTGRVGSRATTVTLRKGEEADVGVGDAYGVPEGRAVVYTVELLHAAPGEVIEELSQPGVKMVLLIYLSGERAPLAGDEPVGILADADMFAHRLVHEDVDLVLDDLLAAWARGEGSEYYDVDLSGDRLIETGPLTRGPAAPGGGRFLALAPSGIRPPGRIVSHPVRLRYRCTHPQHHVVIRPASNTGTTCAEPLDDGSPCPGLLNRF